MEKRIIPFSPPDITESEIEEVSKTLRSGWITTGPKTKLLERRSAAYIETGRNDINCEIREAKDRYSNRVVCLNSATAAEELILRSTVRGTFRALSRSPTTAEQVFRMRVLRTHRSWWTADPTFL